MQLDFPFLSLAGQLAHVHWPGGHVHSVPQLFISIVHQLESGTYEHEDSFLSLLAQLAQEHFPGGQEQDSPHLSLAPSFFALPEER